MPQIHANLSKEASHGWNGLAIKLGVSTSGLLEAVGQLLADETRPGQEAFYEELADRARTIDAMRRQRKVRLLRGLVPAGAGTAAIARVARVAVHRPIASASAGMLALGAIGGGAVIIDQAPGATSHAAAATPQSPDSQVPSAEVLGDGPPNVLPVPPATPGVTTAPPATATTTGSPAAGSPATTATTTAATAAASAAGSPPTTATTTASPAAGSPPPSQPSGSVNAGPVSASVSAGGSGAQVNAQVPVVSAQASVTPSSASVGAQTPVVSAKVSAQTGAVSTTVSSATSTVAGAVKRVAGSVLGA